MLINQNVLCMNLSISLSKDQALVSSLLVGKIIRISQMGHESNYALLTAMASSTQRGTPTKPRT